MSIYSRHAKRKGPGRTTVSDIPGVATSAGEKFAKDAHLGRCGLRGKKVYAAGRLALEGKLGLEYRCREAARIRHLTGS